MRKVIDVRMAYSGLGAPDLEGRSEAEVFVNVEADLAIAPLLREFGAALREVNIDADPVLKERYGWDIPVIFIGQRKAAKLRVDLVQFRRQLQDAGAS